MLKVRKIASYDKLIDVLEYVNDDSGAERVRTINTRYSSVPAAELKASGREKTEEFQVVAVERRAFLIRKLDKTFDETMMVREGGRVYQLVSFHDYGGDRSHTVLEVEFKDNERNA